MLTLIQLPFIAKVLVTERETVQHQAVDVMLSCNELSLNYAIVLYCLLDGEQFNISLTTAPFL